MGNVVELGCVTKLDITPEKVLTAALNTGLENAIVIGETRDGTVYFSMSTADGPLINWLLDVAKRSIMDEAMVPEEEG